MPLLLTPRGLADAGQRLVREFCSTNGYSCPALIEPTKDSLNARLRGYYHVNSCAFYRQRTAHEPTPGIYVMVDKCARPGYAAQAWSWPGYVIDRTPYGVYAHELGHHFDFVLTTKLNMKKRNGKLLWFCESLMKETKEPKLTNYCPNPAEWFAEMFRLFLTNSELLKELRPKTHEGIFCHLNPVEMRPWQKVLVGAPERTIAQAAKKIQEANK